MARQLTWKCTYCDGVNPYENTHCQNCGAARDIDTEFRSIPDENADDPQTPTEVLDNIKDITGKISDIYQDVAPIIGACTGIPQQVTRVRRKARGIFRTIICVIIGIILTALLVWGLRAGY